MDERISIFKMLFDKITEFSFSSDGDLMILVTWYKAVFIVRTSLLLYDTDDLVLQDQIKDFTETKTNPIESYQKKCSSIVCANFSPVRCKDTINLKHFCDKNLVNPENDLLDGGQNKSKAISDFDNSRLDINDYLTGVCVEKSDKSVFKIGINFEVQSDSDIDKFVRNDTKSRLIYNGKYINEVNMNENLYENFICESNYKGNICDNDNNKASKQKLSNGSNEKSICNNQKNFGCRYNEYWKVIAYTDIDAKIEAQSWVYKDKSWSILIGCSYGSIIELNFYFDCGTPVLTQTRVIPQYTGVEGFWSECMKYFKSNSGMLKIKDLNSEDSICLDFKKFGGDMPISENKMIEEFEDLVDLLGDQQKQNHLTDVCCFSDSIECFEYPIEDLPESKKSTHKKSTKITEKKTNIDRDYRTRRKSKTVGSMSNRFSNGNKFFRYRSPFTDQLGPDDIEKSERDFDYIAPFSDDEDEDEDGDVSVFDESDLVDFSYVDDFFQGPEPYSKLIVEEGMAIYKPKNIDDFIEIRSLLVETIWCRYKMGFDVKHILTGPLIFPFQLGDRQTNKGFQFAVIGCENQEIQQIMFDKEFSDKPDITKKLIVAGGTDHFLKIKWVDSSKIVLLYKDGVMTQMCF